MSTPLPPNTLRPSPHDPTPDPRPAPLPETGERVAHALHAAAELVHVVEGAEKLVSVAVANELRLPSLLADAISSKAAAKALHALEGLSESPALRGVGGAVCVAAALAKTVEAADHASARSPAGRAATGALEGLGAFAMMEAPVVGLVDAMVPTALKPSSFVSGVANGAISLIEALATGEHRGVVEQQRKALRGEHGLIIQGYAMIGALAAD